ncbi:MAG: InlB B-repeat-containing protein [Clostridia bacterium]|nr:InlB B-repeat-containing protein [Clostridia bacterium]
MQQFVESAERYTTEYVRRRRRNRIVLALGVFVVFCTTYALILPAITLERSLVCEQTEHIHSAACYEEVEVPAGKAIDCGKEEHSHSDECYVKKVSYICGNTDPDHEHTEDCMFIERELVCGKEEHSHTGECMKAVPAHTEKVLKCKKAEHTHTDACYDAIPDGGIKEPDFVREIDGLTVSVNAPKGAFPSAVTMKVEKVDDEQTLETLRNAVEEKSDKVIAVDISFINADGEEVEPALPVSVKFASEEISGCNEPVVVHLNDEGETALVDQADETVAMNEVSFEAESFSVYAVVDGQVKGRRTYKFYWKEPEGSEEPPKYLFRNNAGIISYYQIVKDGEVLQTIPDPEYDSEENPYVNPDTGEPIKVKREFLGWYLANGTKLEFEQPVTVTQEEEVKVYARFTQVYFVTFYSGAKSFNPDTEEYKNIILTSKAAVPDNLASGEENPPATVTISDITVEAPLPTQAFMGWSYTEGGSAIPGNTITVNTFRTELYPVFEDACWIRYQADKVGEGAEYVPAVHIQPGASISQLGVSTEEGMEFLGWYTEQDGGIQVTDGNGNVVSTAGTTYLNDSRTNYLRGGALTLNEDITLYGHWTGKIVNYTVVFWQQQVTDNKDATDDDVAAGEAYSNLKKHYDYAYHEVRQAQAKTTVSTTNADKSYDTNTPSGVTGDNWAFYTFNEAKNQPITVGKDGNSVLNVYYDRKLMTINFYKKTGNNWPSPDNPNFSFTGLYGQTLTQTDAEGTQMYTYTWPTTERWQEATISNGRISNTLGTTQTYIDGFIFPARYGSNTVYNLGTTGNNGNAEIHHYLEQSDGSFALKQTVKMNSSNSSTFNFTNKFTGYEVTYYVTKGATNTPPATYTANDKKSITSGTSYSNTSQAYQLTYNSNNNDLYVFHVRFEREIVFFDSMGDYEDGNGTHTVAATSMTFKYLDDISSVANKQPDYIRNRYFFTGWYADPACSKKFDFNRQMPNNNLQVYAGWDTQWYWIKIDPNGGALTETEATWFWEEAEIGKVEPYYDVKRDFVEYEDGEYYYHYDEFDTDHALDDDYPQPVTRQARYTTDPDDATDTETKYMYLPSNYSLWGWYKVELDANNHIVKDESGEDVMSLYDFDSPVTGNLLLRAMWKKVGQFNVSYSADGYLLNSDGTYSSDGAIHGTGAPNDLSVYSDKSNAQAMPKPESPDGYEFLYWALVDDEGNIVRRYYPGNTYMINSDYADEYNTLHLKAVYLKYEDLPVEAAGIKYNSNTVDILGNTLVTESGTVLPALEAFDQKIQYNEAIDIRYLNEFTSESHSEGDVNWDQWDEHNGYTFLGWDQNPYLDETQTPQFKYNSGNGKFYVADPDTGEYTIEVTQIAGDQTDPLPNTLYAIWEPTTVRVKISKVVEGTTDDKLKDFDFLVNYIKYNVNTSSKEERNDTFTLKDGDPAKDLDNVVPFGMIMTVTETTADDSFETVYTGIRNTDAYHNPVTPAVTLTPQGSGNNEFVITGDTDITVYNIRKEYAVSIMKTNETLSQPLAGAEFTLKGPDGTVLYDNIVSGTDGMLSASGVTVFNLAHTGGPNAGATNYELIETKQPDGYAMPDNPVITIAVYADKVTVMQNGNERTVEGSTTAADGTAPVTVKVTNTMSGHTLPMTGGSGIFFHITAGALLMTAAAWIYIVRRRRDAVKV